MSQFQNYNHDLKSKRSVAKYSVEAQEKTICLKLSDCNHD